MSHYTQIRFIKQIKKLFPQHFQGTKVLEIGSLDINGGIRGVFEECSYQGVDLQTGPGVDRIIPGDQIDDPDETYDVTISCECFEHNREWIATLKNMIRMTKKGGLVIITCATTGRPEHGTSATDPEASPFTNDYYHNITEEEFASIVNLNDVFSPWMLHSLDTDLRFCGIKKGKVAQLVEYQNAPPALTTFVEHF